MLLEARNRIRTEISNNPSITTSLDLVRCDVGSIPMMTCTVDALHAGAAMHCWPDLQSALSEIYRVLKPGGRYFATTFLSSYFTAISSNANSIRAYQLFESEDMLRKLIIKGGFEDGKVQIEVLGQACVVIRAEK